MNTPGINHVILTVSDLAQSRKFYGDLLGFEINEVPMEHGMLYYFMVGSASVWLITHDKTPPGDRFSEFRIGLDHLAFTAPDKDAVHALADKLIAAGVDTKGAELFYGKWWYVAFRDPDNIQLEYWLNEPEGGEQTE
ncbi:MAG: VOC family protein [Anaerolineae bacterium]|nr:VOC family protein [Anaerolineae bacterium]